MVSNSQVIRQEDNFVLSSEDRLILACLVHGEKEGRESFCRLTAGVNWEDFFETCIRHKVLMQVYNVLNRLDDEVFPRAVRKKIERLYIFENIVHNMELADDLMNVLKASVSGGRC